MRKNVIIFDLDNTIYPVSSIGEKLFKSLFALISERMEFEGDIDKLKAEIMRRPFQFVADEFHFSNKLKADCLTLLAELTYEESIHPFEDYPVTRSLSGRKFLVTTGFPQLQLSKIKQLGIENDFEEIFIIDPGQSDLNKGDVFRKIIYNNSLDLEEIVVVGDDLNSEIAAARELGIDAILYDFKSEYTEIRNLPVISNFMDLELFL